MPPPTSNSAVRAPARKKEHVPSDAKAIDVDTLIKKAADDTVPDIGGYQGGLTPPTLNESDSLSSATQSLSHVEARFLEQDSAYTEQVKALVHAARKGESKKLAQKIVEMSLQHLRQCERLVDTRALRNEVERMVEKQNPNVAGIPKYPGGMADNAKLFFETYYSKYNQKGCEVIFATDMKHIDARLMRALRAAYKKAEDLPIGGRTDRTDALAEGRFGRVDEQKRAISAIGHREYQRLTSK
jgi:hypothetical protein